VDSRLFSGVADRRYYFVHSYAATCLDLPESATMALHPPQVTWTEYGDRFISAVENGPLSATQFHPEKSGDAGIALLRNWLSTL
jgi:glutamine amidotransferase